MSRVAVHDNNNNNDDAHHHHPQVQLYNNAAVVANPHQNLHQPPPPPADVGISTTAPPPAGPCPNATPTTAAVDDKRFTTAYGMVVWPALPGLSGATTTTAASPTSMPTRTIPDLPLVEAAARAGATTQHVHEASAIPRAITAAASGSSSHSNGPLYVITSYNTTLLRAACNACHRMKRKCDGKQPCSRCERRKRDCFYSYKQKSGPPKGSKRKLIEAEDDLPENRNNKPSLGGAPLTLAAPTPAPPWSGDRKGATTPWPEDNIAGTTIINKKDEAYSCAQSGSTPSGPLPLPGPSPEARAAAAAAVAASRMNALAPVPPALAAAGLHRSYMLQPPSVLPGLSGLQPPSVLPGLSGGGGGGGGGGVGGGGGGPVPTTAPLMTHPQYGTVYQHQYPPEVYALYLAELRQRSCGNNVAASGSGGGSGGSSTSTGSLSISSTSTSISGVSNTSSSISSTITQNKSGSGCGGGGGGGCGGGGESGGGGGGGVEVHGVGTPETPTTTMPVSIPGRLCAGRQVQGLLLAAGVSPAVSGGLTTRVASAEGSTDVGPTGTELNMSKVGRMPEPIIFAESSLGVGQDGSDCWGSSGGGGGSGLGGSGGCAPNGAVLTHTTKVGGVDGGGGDEGGGGYLCEPAKAAAAAAAASAALAAAVAAAIAESSSGPSDNGNEKHHRDHNENSELSKPTLPSGYRGGGDAWPSLPGIGAGLRDPVSPAKKGSPLEAESEASALAAAAVAVAAGPRDRGAATTMAVTADVNDLFCGSSGSRATTPRERQAAAGLLLYGARGGQAAGGEHGAAKEKEERFQRSGSSAVAKFGQACPS